MTARLYVCRYLALKLQVMIGRINDHIHLFRYPQNHTYGGNNFINVICCPNAKCYPRLSIEQSKRKATQGIQSLLQNDLARLSKLVIKSLISPANRDIPPPWHNFFPSLLLTHMVFPAFQILSLLSPLLPQRNVSEDTLQRLIVTHTNLHHF